MDKNLFLPVAFSSIHTGSISESFLIDSFKTIPPERESHIRQRFLISAWLHLKRFMLYLTANFEPFPKIYINLKQQY